MCLAQPGKIKKIEHNTAVVDFGGITRSVSLGILTDVKINEYVLVHAGFAIGKVSKEEAEDTQQILNEIRKLGTATYFHKGGK